MTNKKTFSALDQMAIRQAPETQEHTEPATGKTPETKATNVKNATFSIPVELLQCVKYIGVVDSRKFSAVVVMAIQEYAEKWAAEHGKNVEDMKF